MRRFKNIDKHASLDQWLREPYGHSIESLWVEAGIVDQSWVCKYRFFWIIDPKGARRMGDRILITPTEEEVAAGVRHATRADAEEAIWKAIQELDIDAPVDEKNGWTWRPFRGRVVRVKAPPPTN